MVVEAQTVPAIDAFFSLSLDLLCIADTQGHFLKLNPAWSDTLGYEIEDLEGVTFLDLVHPDDIEATLQAIGQLQDKEDVLHFRNRYRCKDGEYRDIEWLSTSPDGKTIYACARDVTETTGAAERAQTESEAKYRTIADFTFDWEWWRSADGKLAYSSPSAEQVTGYPGQAFVDDPGLLSRITVDEDRAALEAHVADPDVGDAEHGELVFHVRGPDGEVRTIEHRCRRAYAPDGTFVGIRASNRDVTERDRAVAALRLKNTVFDASIAANSIADTEGRLTEVNDAFLQLWEFPDRDAVIGRSIAECLDSEVVAGQIVTALAETGMWEGDYVARCGNGARKTVHGMATTLVDDDGAVIGYQSAVIDVTEVRRAEAEIRRLNAELEDRVDRRTAELEAANRELEAFAYSVSHDLRAPLRSIDGFSHALLEDYDDKLDDEGRDFLHRIRRSTQQMACLIDDMLKLSRLTRAPMKVTDVDVSARAETALGRLREADPAREVIAEVEPGIHVTADADLVGAALENLLGNAWKFTSKVDSARITVSSAEGDPGMRAFCVADNGAGFDMRYADKLFGAFQRLHKAEEFPGTGIGLATVQRVVNRHGGRVWAEGAVGEGARFYMEFPIEHAGLKEDDDA